MTTPIGTRVSSPGDALPEFGNVLSRATPDAPRTRYIHLASGAKLAHCSEIPTGVELDRLLIYRQIDALGWRHRSNIDCNTAQLIDTPQL